MPMHALRQRHCSRFGGHKCTAREQLVGGHHIIRFQMKMTGHRPNFGSFCIFTRMWQSFIFGMHWKHDGKLYYDELPAESKEEAAEYFIDHMRDDVSLVRVELVGPNEGGVREFTHSPDSPFSPLVARRRLDKDED